MEVVSIFCCYNEIKLLPIRKKWCDSERIKMAMVDNYSNDGSYEWGLKNCEYTCRVNTNDTFDIAKLQKGKEEIMHHIKPDQIIRGGVDTFLFAEIPLKEIIKKSKGYDIIECDLIEIYNTGEKTNNILDYYYYKLLKRKAGFIHRYMNCQYITDDYDKQYNRIYIENMVCLNYGSVKSAKERNETYERRKGAWRARMHSGWGTHYIGGHKKNWVWEKSECQDLRQSKYWYFLKDKLEMLR